MEALLLAAILPSTTTNNTNNCSNTTSTTSTMASSVHAQPVPLPLLVVPQREQGGARDQRTLYLNPSSRLYLELEQEYLRDNNEVCMYGRSTIGSGSLSAQTRLHTCMYGIMDNGSGPIKHANRAGLA
jgi:hypothetical protein